MVDAGNLIWIDLEMTGLDTGTDTIIEIATIVTDANLNELADGPVLTHWRVGSSVGGIDFEQDLLLYRGLAGIEAPRPFPVVYRFIPLLLIGVQFTHPVEGAGIFGIESQRLLELQPSPA